MEAVTRDYYIRREYDGYGYSWSVYREGTPYGYPGQFVSVRSGLTQQQARQLASERNRQLYQTLAAKYPKS